MFFPDGQVRVRLYGCPADMRRSFNGLSVLTSHPFGQDPMNGALCQDAISFWTYGSRLAARAW